MLRYVSEAKKVKHPTKSASFRDPYGKEPRGYGSHVSLSRTVVNAEIVQVFRVREKLRTSYLLRRRVRCQVDRPATIPLYRPEVTLWLFQINISKEMNYGH